MEKGGLRLHRKCEKKRKEREKKVGFFPVYVLTYVYFTMIGRVFHNVLSSECTAKSLGRNLVKKIHMICM